MSNLNKIYHKGKFRSYEWGKSIGSYLKRKGNKQFRKSKLGFVDENLDGPNSKKRTSHKPIKAKITFMKFSNITLTRYRKYRSMRDLKNSINRPNVIRYLLIE